MLILIFLMSVSCALSEDVQRPNILMFLTDDQDLVLNGMEPMTSVRKLIANEGATFSNAFVASPICCPSRASILTGMYPHNHGTFNNSESGGCSGVSWRRHHNNTFANILHKNGYQTFYAGKYLNQYGVKLPGATEVPPGWSEWHGLVGNSVYYNYTLSNNGVPAFEANEYLTDHIRKLGLDFLSGRDKLDQKRPFLMVLAPPAPHQPFTPAPRHRGFYSNVTTLKTLSFNVTAKDKHWMMRMQPSPLPPGLLSILDDAYRSRWETLLAVDEMAADVLHKLEETGEIHNTYVIYTSDNGYHIGQFSQVLDKRQPYETDIRVPLMIRGPGIDKKILIKDPTINVDLAPTILSMVGIEVPKYMDGVPIEFKPKKDIKERNMLIEYYGEGSSSTVNAVCADKLDGMFSECSPNYACKCQDVRNNTYSCVRHLYTNIDFKYCRFNDTEKFEEMYDLNADPFELTNIVHEVMPALRFWYQLTLDRLRACSGLRCNAGPAA